jgi:hypothetical protein
MFSALLLVVASSLGLWGIEARSISHAPRALRERSITTSVSRPTAFKRSSQIAVTDNVVSLSKRSVKYNKRSAAYLLGKITDTTITGTYANGSSSVLTSLEIGEEYATPITIGTQTFEVIVDTGSSDTWVVETGFECIDFSTGKKTTESECDFGPYYTKDSTFVQTADENFNIEYGDGESLTGIIGTETVTLAGVEVTDQTIALVTIASWEGDGTTSGLTGLAYTALCVSTHSQLQDLLLTDNSTSAYKGTDPSDDTTQVEYSPIIETLINKDLIAAPLFSLAILRDVSGDAGYLALGGVPPISFTQDFTSTPILVTTISGYPDAYDFYTVNIDEVVLNGAAVASSGGSSIQYIVSSYIISVCLPYNHHFSYYNRLGRLRHYS